MLSFNAGTLCLPNRPQVFCEKKKHCLSSPWYRPSENLATLIEKQMWEEDESVFLNHRLLVIPYAASCMCATKIYAVHV